jgi:hypothetical protein
MRKVPVLFGAACLPDAVGSTCWNMGSAMSRSTSKIMFLCAGGLACLLMLIEVSAYVLTVSSVPARIRGRMGKGSVAFHVEQRQKMLEARSQAVFTVATAGGSLPTDEYSGPAMFHGALGWDYPANILYRGQDGMLYGHGPDGERRTCTSFPATEIATYGDSFTHCDEVSDEHTWQTFLGLRIGSNVLNYGVGGYGTDQAFLKFQLHKQPKARVAVLCILPENINRVVNIYRPFYNYDDPLALTKPRFIREGSEFKLVPNPIPQVGLLQRLEDPTFLSTLGTVDYWYQHDRNMPRLGFPFALSAFAWRKEIADRTALILCPFLPRWFQPHYGQNLFDEPEPFAIMCHIVDLFVQTARDRGLTPIIAVMPHKDYVREVMEYRVSRVARLTSYLRQKKYPFVDLIQAMAEIKPSRTQLESWYSGHATVQGNKVTADLMAAYLRRQGLPPDRPAR